MDNVQVYTRHAIIHLLVMATFAEYIWLFWHYW